MPEEFEGDLAGAVFSGADLSGARFRDVDLARRDHQPRLARRRRDRRAGRQAVINVVDVTAYVNERGPWYPLRGMLRRPTRTTSGRRRRPSMLGGRRRSTERVLSPTRRSTSRSTGWSFVRRCGTWCFAIDKWFTAPVLGEGFDPIGLPNSGSVDFPWPGLDYGLTPSVSEALGVRAAAYVNERDPWYPLRAMLRPSNPEDMRATWAALEDEWAKTITRAQALPEDRAASSRSTTSGRFVADAATSRLRDGQVVHGADPRRRLPPDGVAEQRLGRLPVARPRLRPDAVCLGSPRRSRGSRHAAFATTSRSVATTDFTHDRSTCSRTARTRCRSASTPSSRKSSGTTVTRALTSCS